APEVRVRGEVVDDDVHRPSDPLGRDHARIGFGEELREREESPLEDGLVERLLAGEVVVEARRRQLELTGQVPDGHPVDAVLREHHLRGIENDLARRQRLDQRLPRPGGPLAQHGSTDTQMNERSSTDRAAEAIPGATGHREAPAPAQGQQNHDERYCPVAISLLDPNLWSPSTASSSSKTTSIQPRPSPSSSRRGAYA